jgi:hypothetical protein
MIRTNLAGATTGAKDRKKPGGWSNQSFFKSKKVLYLRLSFSIPRFLVSMKPKYRAGWPCCVTKPKQYLLFSLLLIVGAGVFAQTRQTDLLTGKMGFAEATGRLVIPMEYDFLPVRFKLE